MELIPGGSFGVEDDLPGGGDALGVALFCVGDGPFLSDGRDVVLVFPLTSFFFSSFCVSSEIDMLVKPGGGPLEGEAGCCF